MRQAMRYKSTADYTTAEIRHLILSGELPAGAPIDQIDLAKRLDVSRHPVRQAIERLSERGFIYLNPHRSAVVAEISANDMEELYSARRVVEHWAITSAWPNYTAETRRQIRDFERQLRGINPAQDLDAYMDANRSFHLAMYEPCRNRYILRNIISLFDLSERYQRTALLHEMRIKRSAQDHAEMVEAIERGDCNQLIALLTAHNSGTQATVLDNLHGAPVAAGR